MHSRQITVFLKDVGPDLTNICQIQPIIVVLSCMERDDTLEILLSDGCIRLVILECVDM